jgi:hypothetical protein
MGGTAGLAVAAAAPIPLWLPSRKIVKPPPKVFDMSRGVAGNNSADF